jgi:hypothetical protein
MKEKQVMIAAKMYESRERAKRLMGAEYPERIAPFMGAIKSRQKEWNLDVIPTVMRMLQERLERGNAEAGFILLAAAVELIEPSKGVC